MSRTDSQPHTFSSATNEHRSSPTSGQALIFFYGLKEIFRKQSEIRAGPCKTDGRRLFQPGNFLNPDNCHNF